MEVSKLRHPRKIKIPVGAIHELPLPISVIFLILIFSFAFSACSVESSPPSISGRINISPMLASKVGPSDIVYVMALSPEVTAESNSKNPETLPMNTQVPPLVVQKIIPAVFPLRYSLSQEDVILPEKKLAGPLIIVAKVDKNGTAYPLQKGDLQGYYKKNPVELGNHRVDILIDRELK